MATAITTFKKIMLDLDISGTSQYSLTNDLSNNNTCFLEFNLMTNVTNKSVTITFEQYTSQGGSLENTETFILNYKNNTLSRNINIITAYTLITITNNAFNGILSGFIEKLIIGDSITLDASGQTVAVIGDVDISGQRVDISGQRVVTDISGQRVDISGQRVVTDISGQRVVTDISGQRLDISGQRVDISGQRVDISGQRVDISGQRVDISGQIVDISGQSIYILSNDISSNLPTQIKSTTNFEGIVGLNCYQIYPKKIIYPLHGNSSGAVAGQFIGAAALAYAWTDVLIGLNYVRQFNIYHNGVGTKYIDVEYIDSFGNFASSSYRAITTNSTNIIIPNAININRLSWSPTVDTPNNVTTTVIVKDSVLGVYRNNLNSFNCGSSIITCPNGYIGIISDLYCYTSGGDDFIMIIKDKYNSIKTVRYMPGITPTNNKYYPIGYLNYPLYEGESVFFAGALATGGSRHVNVIVTLTAI
jgi:hypothetical protein